MIDLFLEFWSLQEPYLVWVLLGSVILGLSAGVLGSFIFLQKRGLIGDVLAHASLPGVTSSFLIFADRDPLVILLGAVVSNFLGIFVIEYLVKRTKIKEDAALTITLSLFFAVGIFQLTIIQRSGTAAQAGLSHLLFGQAASLTKNDVIILGSIAFGLLIFIALSFRSLKLIIFDRQFAKSLGCRVFFYEALLSLAVVLAVVIGLQLVGVILMAAILVTPPAAARYWSDNVLIMIVLAALFGALAGAFGANISYLAPGLSTGPWIVMFLTAVFGISIFFAPQRGILTHFLSHCSHKRKVNNENLLHTLYKIGEDCGEERCHAALEDILAYRNMEKRELHSTLKRLRRKGLVKLRHNYYHLTRRGLWRAKLITRKHRLFELYLERKINVPADHVHHMAEDAEHVLSSDIEKEVLEELHLTNKDPHGSKIPIVEHMPREGR
ncbi:MAG: metal ABC transporter permease [Chlamydiota bacterium]